LDTIRAAGDPVSILDWKMEEVPPAQNALTYLDRAEKDAKSLTEGFAPLWDKMFQKSENGDYEEAVYPTEEVQKTIASGFAAHPEVMILLEKAANCPGYSEDFLKGCRDKETIATGEVLDALMESMQQRRMFGRILYLWRFSMLFPEKRYDECVEDEILLLKLCRHAEKDPVLIGFLVNCAIRGQALVMINNALQAGPVSEELHRAVEDEVAKINMRRDFLHTLKTERAFAMDSFREMQSWLWLSRVMLNREIISILDAFDWYVGRTNEKLSESDSSTFKEISSTPPSSGRIFEEASVRGLQAAEKAVRRIEVQTRVLRVVNALVRREKPDEMPLADLSDLGLPKEVTTDPYSGKPLIVKKVDDGWLVYSVGENQKNDGGQINDQLPDIGMEPIQWAKPQADESE
jgi:hypothetical protein